MQITLTAKRQATFPAAVCKAMGIKAGDRLEISQGATPEEWVIRSSRIDASRLAPLKQKLRKHRPLDLQKFRNAPKNYAALRD